WQLLAEEPVSRAEALVDGQAEHDDVDLRQGVAHQVVEPLPQQRARAVQPRGVDQHELAVLAVHDAAHGAPRRLRPHRGDRDLLAHERVGERRLARVGAPDDAHEPRPEALGLLVLRHPSTSSTSGTGARETRMVSMRRRRPAALTASRTSPCVVAWAPTIGTLPSALASSPATVSTSSSSSSSSNRSPTSSSGIRAGTRKPPSPSGSTSGSLRSCSSVSSPTTSSSTSSIVTRPAMPPHSSKTSAMWMPEVRISSSTSSTGLVSGTSTGSRSVTSTGSLSRSGRSAV